MSPWGYTPRTPSPFLVDLLARVREKDADSVDRYGVCLRRLGFTCGSTTTVYCGTVSSSHHLQNVWFCHKIIKYVVLPQNDELCDFCHKIKKYVVSLQI